MSILFRLLGPVALGRSGNPGGITVPKVRCMLAVLLLDADRVVSLERLTDELWGDQPPRSAVANLRSYALALRRALAAAGIDPDRLATTPGGYRLHVTHGEYDVSVWQSLAGEGTAALAEGRVRDAVTRLGRALDCWTGPALADVPVGPALAARATALDELRTAHTEDLLEARLLSGEGIALVTPLREHIAAYPTRERAYGQLMRVLYTTGDAAAALDVYQQARQVLAEELGLEPGDGLREIQAAVLRRDPALASGRGNAEVRPRQLPPDATDLVGRERELVRLSEVTARVRNIHGPGGVGKSALAIRLAHALAEDYPDGQLYLDLQGSNPRLTPLDPGDVLRRFLRALGTPDDDTPADTAEAAAMFRTQLAGRRLLVLLDNAVDAAQVRQLLPGTPHCLVLVTSRRALTSLDSAALLPLDVLDEADALRLLGSRADAQAAQQLAALCGRLPLALRIAAARLDARPDWSAADLVERLVDERGRLDELHTDDMAVRSCFQASYRALDAPAARAFRMAGLARAPHLSVTAMAALLGQTRAVAASALDRLVEARLVDMSTGRVQLHDLLRLYAAECALHDDPAQERAEALHRLFVYYVGTAHRALQQVVGVVRPVDATLQGPEGTELVPIRTLADASSWLDAELPAATAVAAQAGEATPVDRRYPAQLLRAMSNYLLRRAPDQVDQLAALALRLHAPDDPQSAGIAHNMRGQAYYFRRRYAESRASLEQALSFWRARDDPDGIATVTNSLGILASRMGELDEALHHFQDSHDALAVIGATKLRALVLLNVCEVLTSQERVDEAIATVHRSLRLVRRDRGAAHTMMALGILALLHAKAGDPRQALSYCRRSMAIADAQGDVAYFVDMALVRSEIHLHVQRPDLAGADTQTALRRARDIEDFGRQGAALWQIAKVRQAAGDRAAAARCRAEASRLFEQYGRSQEQVVETFLVGDGPALPHPP
ncbi:AfsR/SARP family transcriptional regulator [Catellatospora sichuanensis]|uniref:AfsR/SARP family transcriptional regulator n=1 Tax=Catellatospora sichuanensis TaxID=1969805 RepID=UPI001642BD98|nr:BTAD domain-containing putative transcriptional regulator [Catellatospora sichuanensis]